MELKDFVKNVIKDITTAIEECQDELSPKASVAPFLGSKDQNPNVIRTVLGYAQINNIDFDIALTTETQEQTSSGISAGIRVFDIMRLGGENKDMNQNIAQCVSRVKFTIPVVYPHSEVAIQATLAQNKPQRPTYGEETNQNQSSL